MQNLEAKIVQIYNSITESDKYIQQHTHNLHQHLHTLTLHMTRLDKKVSYITSTQDASSSATNQGLSALKPIPKLPLKSPVPPLQGHSGPTLPGRTRSMSISVQSPSSLFPHAAAALAPISPLPSSRQVCIFLKTCKFFLPCFVCSHLFPLFCFFLETEFCARSKSPCVTWHPHEWAPCL